MTFSAPTSIIRIILTSLVSLTALGLFARAQAASPDEQATALLESLAAGEARAGSLEAATELAALASRADVVDAIKGFLDRERTTTPAQRREVLLAINADVPDSKGRFRSSRRRDEPVNRGDDFDWLAGLVELEPRAGLDEVLADVIAIRALAASKRTEGANALLDFAFEDHGSLYRDECGRYLRKMAPYSLPALIAASQNNRRKKRSLRRYAKYQLDRLDRQNPNKAMNHASEDPALLVEVIEAYGKSKHREAVVPLLDRINDGSPTTREAARTALLGYVTGRPPPEAPKRKLALPGGKLTDEEQPLWLTYRELADVELRRRYKEVFGKRASRRSSPAKVARQLFAHYDELREQALLEAYDEAAALAEAGQWAEATAAFDRLLAERPEHPRRKDMARAYFEHAHTLVQAGSYRDAAAAYSKAHGLDPEAPFAKDALAGHYTALGKALQAEGKDGSAALRRARDIEPNYKEPRGVSSLDRPRPTWMLYAGVGGGAGALILLILGLAVRRR